MSSWLTAVTLTWARTGSDLCLTHHTFLSDLHYSNKTKQPHLTHRHQRPRPTADRHALHSADSSPSPHLVLGPSLQEGHYNSPLRLTCNIDQDYIITTHSAPCGHRWCTSGPAHREEVPPQRTSFGQFWPRAAHLTAATQVFRAQIVEQPQHDFCWKLGDVSWRTPGLFQFWGKWQKRVDLRTNLRKNLLRQTTKNFNILSHVCAKQDVENLTHIKK